MEQMFLRNIPALSREEQELLHTKRVAVIGCGGLGGYVIEFLVRAGVGAVTAADGDCFEQTNLNRQLLCLGSSLGENKALAAAKRAAEINPNVNFCAVPEFFASENAEEILKDADLVIDALDSTSDRILLEAECGKRGLTLVHGAVSGWSAQICVIRPGSESLRRLYAGGETVDKSCLCHTAAFCAALQACESVKLLCGKQSAADGTLLITDLLTMETASVKI